MADIETKLSAARTRLILDKPFLGALVLRLPLIAADPSWCKTTATDARAFYYHRAYIEALTLAQTEFVLAHEALHCALLHFSRRHHRIKPRWDLACDLAINPLLIEGGLVPPPGALALPEFNGMTAEEIYPFIEDRDDETFDYHVYDDDHRSDCKQFASPGRAGAGSSDASVVSQDAKQPAPLSSTERHVLEVRWQQRLVGAAQQALQAGKLTATMARLVDGLLESQLPWRALLAHYLSTVARDDYSFSRLSKREGPAVLPSLRAAQVELVVALDTSGSIGADELTAFLSEINALKGQLRARITLHACDDHLAPSGPWVCEAWEDLTLPAQLSGGGGTSFIPVFEWEACQDRAPEALLYFTDGHGAFPDQPPSYPVLWLIKGRAPVPWGRRIQLN